MVDSTARRLRSFDRVRQLLRPVKACSLDAAGPEAQAQRTPEGYLLTVGYVGRDGPLDYPGAGEGGEDLVLWRSREELLASAASLPYCPLTLDHPSEWITSKNWARYAKGVHLDACRVLEPDSAGVSYLAAQLLWTDQDMIDQILAAKVIELSTGYDYDRVMYDTPKMLDGVAVHGEQRGIVYNHTAGLPEDVPGRAGPKARIYVFKSSLDSQSAKGDTRKMEEIEITGPDGQAVKVPGWVVEAIKAQTAPAATDEGDAPGEALEGAPTDTPEDEPLAQSADAAGAFTPEMVAALVRKRSRLSRLASLDGAKASFVDEASDDDLARYVIAKRLPSFDAAKTLTGEALDAALAAALAVPVADPLTVPQRAVDAGDDLGASAIADYLKTHGMEA